MKFKAIPKRPGLIDALALITNFAVCYWVFRPDFMTSTILIGLNIYIRFLIYLVFSGIQGVLVAGCRGGSRFGGFILGFMLGPFGLLMATSLGPSRSLQSEGSRP